MTKVDFVRKVKSTVGEDSVVLTMEDTEKIIDAVFGALKTELKETKKASLFGFGTFEIVKRDGRAGKTPAGVPFVGKASNAVRFKAAAALKREFND